jgi:hypothetical protein
VIKFWKVNKKEKPLNNLIKTILISALFISNTIAADKFTFGFGLGNSTYSGLGVNIGLASKTDLKYISYGVKSYGSYDGWTFGKGLGWIKTDLIQHTSNNHGLGIYAGIVDKEDNSLSYEKKFLEMFMVMD